MSSPVFHAMFYGEMAEKESVEIKDIEPDAFKGMLQWVMFGLRWIQYYFTNHIRIIVNFLV